MKIRVIKITIHVECETGTVYDKSNVTIYLTY